MLDRPTIKIGMKPILKYFLQSVYGTDQAILLSQSDQLSALLTLLLIKKPKNRQIREPNGSYIEFYLPIQDHPRWREYNYLLPSAKKRIEKRIDLLFWVAFEEFIYEALRLKLGRTDAVILFMEKYGLPPEGKMKQKLQRASNRSKRLTDRFPKRSYSCRKGHQADQ